MLLDTIILLVSAVITVPIFKRLGLGAVLGYLVAGVAVGPFGFDRFDDVDEILHFAELGVVLLLFIIGLELQPSRLWALRRSIFGFGSAQLFVTAAAIAVLAESFADLSWTVAVILGLTLALSSTAFALQLLAERGELSQKFGRTAFATLLFQDIAVVPLLAMLPLFGAGSGKLSWTAAGMAVAILLAAVVGGRYVLRYLLRIAALTNVREMLTATALLTVLGMATLLNQAGLSMALGAFLAGVLLADSEFRHQLEADIEPFKGLLLGLFFIAVGMSVNLGLIAEQTGRVVIAVGLLVATKFAVLYGLGKLNGLDSSGARRLGLTLSQGGEFAFVVLSVAVAASVVSDATAEFVIVVVCLSMASTPLLVFANSAFFGRRHSEPEYDPLPEELSPVIIAGFGRFGQMTARILRAKGIPFTALESNQTQVDFVRKFGNQIFYGDAARLDLLQAAGAKTAKFLVLAIDDVETSLRIAEMIRDHFPNLTVFARARNRKHVYQLMDLGIEIIHRETFAAAVELAVDVLKGLGIETAERDAAAFRAHDEHRLLEHREMHTDEARMQDLAKQAAKELEEMFERDAEDGLS
jgi:monovalent cation:proton antiporter-2 (CPA2) family protein